jgi:DNA-directed RNA polymerase subunit N (RpoN/RPB10)
VWLCPFCGKQVSDTLYHLRFVHEVEDIEQFMQALDRVGAEEERRREFAAFVEELQVKVRRGLITWEDYRRLRDEWSGKQE